MSLLTKKQRLAAYKILRAKLEERRVSGDGAFMCPFLIRAIASVAPEVSLEEIENLWVGDPNIVEEIFPEMKEIKPATCDMIGYWPYHQLLPRIAAADKMIRLCR